MIEKKKRNKIREIEIKICSRIHNIYHSFINVQYMSVITLMSKTVCRWQDDISHGISPSSFSNRECYHTQVVKLLRESAGDRSMVRIVLCLSSSALRVYTRRNI